MRAGSACPRAGPRSPFPPRAAARRAASVVSSSSSRRIADVSTPRIATTRASSSLRSCSRGRYARAASVMLSRSRSRSAAMRDLTARLFWRVVRRIAPTHGLPEAVLRREPLEVMALRRVARDPIEEDSKRLRGVQALRVERLVHEQLHHHELVDRCERGALHELLEAIVELRDGWRLDRE